MISRKVFVICLASFFSCLIAGVWFLHSEIFMAEAQYVPEVKFSVQKGESVASLARRLADNRVVRHAGLFKKYVAWKGVDNSIQAGDYTVTAPITLARVVDALAHPVLQNERTITIIPGWDLRDVGEYFEKEGIQTQDEFFKLVGIPVRKNSEFRIQNSELPIVATKPANLNLEGYLAPETYRVFKNATAEEIVEKLIAHRAEQFTEQMRKDITAQGKTVHEILTMASILEQEVRSKEDKVKVSDLFWRRLGAGIALQADSTVHYVVGKAGSVFTTAKDRETDSLWNTYKYPGLPPGPICNPGLESIMAAIYPEKNDAWYFLTTSDGEVKYGRTLDEHNANRARYL